MRYFIIGFIAWVMLILPGSATSAEEEHKILMVKKNMREMMTKDEEGLKMCGNYFAGMEMPKRRIIHFSFEKKSAAEQKTTYVFADIDAVVISISENMPFPTVIILGDEKNPLIVLRMDRENYKEGLPCLSKVKGIKI